MARARLLIVEDSPVVLRFCTTVLQAKGFELLLTDNGLEGLFTFQKHGSEIDLALIDVSMPELNGIDLTRRIFELRPDAKIILMTGYTPDMIVPEDLQKLCSLLMKPFTAATLVKAVESCLDCED